MIIGIPKEILPGETRVALVPGLVGVLTKMEHQILIEKDAGVAASFSDDQYVEAGAKIALSADEVFSKADIILRVQPPLEHPV